ncbi:sensor histidine kinase [Myxococcus fulvus]|uniref:sensor histidine kinase n=1 Tax=Myxococcus fulvus TaxID=33 RepID=UPI003B9B05C8
MCCARGPVASSAWSSTVLPCWPCSRATMGVSGGATIGRDLGCAWWCGARRARWNPWSRTSSIASAARPSETFVHSRAREIEVSLLFEHPELRLCVRDDGRGIDVATLERGGRAGHWGLRGMRERAEKVGGRLDIISGEGRGTEVQVVVRAQRAYLRRPLEGLRRLVPRLGRR